MKNVELVKAFESIDNLYEYTPNFPFLKKLFFGFVVKNFLIEVPIIQKFHNNAVIKAELP